MKLVQSILTKNPCYTAGKKITVKGLMLHSVGCQQPKASVFINSWNSPSYNNACVHGFIEGNTRTTAVFFIKYLRTLGFDVTNDVFAENAWYFRNSLVRANYNDLKNSIYETTEYLEVFLRNLLLNENHPLHNRTLHISGTFKETDKPDIETVKPDIGATKADIEKKFQPKTASHILKLREAFLGQTIFGRSDVMEVIDIKPSRASELLKEMSEHGVIEPVTGHGKGKYRFRQQ